MGKHIIIIEIGSSQAERYCRGQLDIFLRILQTPAVWVIDCLPESATSSLLFSWVSAGLENCCRPEDSHCGLNLYRLVKKEDSNFLSIVNWVERAGVARELRAAEMVLKISTLKVGVLGVVVVGREMAVHYQVRS